MILNKGGSTMNERKSFESRVLLFLTVIILLQVVILFKQFQVEDRIIESLRGLYYDLVEVVK